MKLLKSFAVAAANHMVKQGYCIVHLEYPHGFTILIGCEFAATCYFMPEYASVSGLINRDWVTIHYSDPDFMQQLEAAVVANVARRPG